MDCYQLGFQIKESTPAAQQVGRTSDASVAAAREAASAVAALGDDAHDPAGWRALAEELESRLWWQVHFADRDVVLEARLLLFGQIGRAAALSGDRGPPLYRSMAMDLPDGGLVNLYWYKAAQVLVEMGEQPSRSGVTEPGLIAQYMAEIRSAGVQGLANLPYDGRWSATYQVVLNGEVVPWPEDQALSYPFFHGHIFLRHADGNGYGPSFWSNDNKTWNPMGNAGRAVRSLREDLAEGEPPMGVWIKWLATYQALHPDSEVFIAMPRRPAGKTRLWRWDRVSLAIVPVD